MKQLAVLVAALCLCALASADFNTGVEAPADTGSPGGTLLTGQQAWYNPVAGSVDWTVHTYAGNIYGVPNDPFGGTQFAAGLSQGGTAYARAEHPMDWSSRDTWNITYDLLVQYRGAPPGTDNIGSFSLQPSASANYFQSLYLFQDPNTATNWRSGFLTLENPSTAFIPGAAWQNLEFNHWYRESMAFTFSTQLIGNVSITDLSTMVTTTVTLNQHLLNPSGAIPTAFRMFSGGTTAGNLTVYDNISIVPEPAAFLLLALGGLLARRR